MFLKHFISTDYMTGRACTKYLVIAHLINT